ncbi:SDR family oxidoreductase, partial [Rhodococcus hoagii]|nr:SDR family oxidoreductase [Prescottella equi]
MAAELRPPERFPRHRSSTASTTGCGTRLPRRLSRHRHRLLQPLQGGPRSSEPATSLSTPKHIGLRSNSLSPGTIGTPLLKTSLPPWVQRTSTAPRPGRPHAHADEVADALLFLASSESSWISGADIPIDGGLSSMVFR